MISSSKGTPSTRDILEDRLLTFNCGQFARGITASRPLSHRWVTAKECLCTHDTREICDPTRLYNLQFYELSDEAMAQRQRDLSEKYPDTPPDQIGVFQPDGGPTSIFVPPHFLDVLWNAALAADGVLRSITLTAQPRKRGGWSIFDVSLSEEMAEFFEWPLDKNSNPKFAPPRNDPAVVELRAVREQLRWLRWSRGGPGIVNRRAPKPWAL
jgi:hypothetical protein